MRQHIFIIHILLITIGLTMMEAEADVQATSVKIAMCQIFALDGDRGGNFVRIEAALREAKERGADIACFPETSILGWVNPEAHKRAYPIPGEDSERLTTLAKKYSVYVCIGVAEKDRDRLYDSVILIDDKGCILLKHRKINLLSWLMAPPYTPGEAIEAVDTKYGRIGLLICADTFKEDLCKRMAERAPDLVIVPYGWAADETAWPEFGNKLRDTVVQAAAWISSPVIGTDLVGMISNGPWKGRVCGGQSIAADATGALLSRAKDRERDVVIFSVDLGPKR